MKVFRILIVLVLPLFLGMGMTSVAQTNDRQSKSVSISTDDDGKVKLKVTIKNGDDQQIFEKEYDSYEEMQDDPELDEFDIDFEAWDIGNGRSFSFSRPGGNLFFNGPGAKFFNDSTNRFSFFFGDDDDADKNFFFDMDEDFRERMEELRERLQNGAVQGFSFFDDDDGFTIDIDSLKRHSFRFDGNGNQFYLNGKKYMDIESLQDALREQMQDMDFDFNIDMFGWGDEDGRVFRWDPDDDEENSFRVIVRTKVAVRSAEEEDLKKVGADQMEDLQIRDISFYPNPSNGRFSVELSTGNDDPVLVKVINPEGAVVYEKSDQLEGGDYDFRIDLSGKRQGIYILQVIQNDRALTKRIIIE